MRSQTTWFFLLAAVAVVLCVCLAIGGGMASLVMVQSQRPVPTLNFSNQPTLVYSPEAPVSTLTAVIVQNTPLPNPSNIPGPGKIVYVCQVFRLSSADQICIMDADGSNQRRLTTSDKNKHYYPALAPDGQSVVFSANLAGPGLYDIYELDFSGNQKRLTKDLGILNSPEISPDGKKIAFTRGDGVDKTELWLMDRDGSSPHKIYGNGWDPTWSPDGSLILFATNVPGYGAQLATISMNGENYKRLTDVRDLRGRSDWSDDNQWLITYLGKPWKRELYIMEIDGSKPRRISPLGGNSQGPSFSPDGQWIVFTAYFDAYGDDHGCEIYKMRIDGSSLTRLTSNNYCDWQPRWGP